MKKLVLVSCLLVGAAWVLWMPLTAVAQEQAVEETALLAELEEEEGGRTLQDWFEMGGWIMWGILFCSVLTLGLVLERLWALRRNGIIPHGLLSKLNQHMKRREMSQVLTLCGIGLYPAPGRGAGRGEIRRDGAG